MVGITDISRALRGLMERAAAKFPYTTPHYPEKHLDCGLAFELSHGVVHMTTTLGEIAAQAERRDHGKRVDHDALHKATVMMIVHALRLAVSLGMKPEDVARMAYEQTEPPAQK